MQRSRRGVHPTSPGVEAVTAGEVDRHCGPHLVEQRQPSTAGIAALHRYHAVGAAVPENAPC
jgi:hypothetical protein